MPRRDKFRLYELSVQNAPADIDFATQVFRKERGRLPLTLREDFCGTAILCCEWVSRQPKRRAYGIDLHKPTLAWAERHRVGMLSGARERVRLICGDVCDGCGERVDWVAAFNFSYSVFKTRPDLLRYFASAHRELSDDGAFFLDLHGGPEAQMTLVEPTRFNDFTYVWEQRTFDPVNNFTKCSIHFRFPDGTQLRHAFRYDWRLWSLPELKDALLEAGFRRVDAYWEGDDGNGKGNGVFHRVARAPNDPSWVAYLVAWR